MQAFKVYEIWNLSLNYDCKFCCYDSFETYNLIAFSITYDLFNL